MVPDTPNKNTRSSPHQEERPMSHKGRSGKAGQPAPYWPALRVCGPARVFFFKKIKHFFFTFCS